MAFQIKSFASIAASMVNVMRSVTNKITDFRVGSAARTMVEATAAELEELYINILVGLREAIPVSVFNTFGFEALPPEAGSVVINFSTGGVLATVPIKIPAGTLVQVPGGSVNYATADDAYIQVGQSYVLVLASAQTAGLVGNVDANTITTAVTPLPGVAVITNPAPVINGRDQETDDERRIRFQAYIGSLARGTKAADAYGAKTAKLVDASGVIIEYVAFALVVEPYVTDATQPVAKVLIYIHNGAAATSADLVAQAQMIVDGYIDSTGVAVPGWKAAGVPTTVLAASDVPVSITGTLVLQAGYDGPTTVDAATKALAAYLQSLSVGAPVLISEITAICRRDVPGVYNYVPAAPTADVAIGVTQKATAGTITLTAA